VHSLDSRFAVPMITLREIAAERLPRRGQNDFSGCRMTPACEMRRNRS
jgi:hypothetical protein